MKDIRKLWIVLAVFAMFLMWPFFALVISYQYSWFCGVELFPYLHKDDNRVLTMFFVGCFTGMGAMAVATYPG